MRLIHAILAALVLALFAVPSSAAECRPGYSLPEITSSLAGNGVQFGILPQEHIAAFLAKVAPDVDASKVTNIIIAEFQGHYVYGIEVDGCVGEPVPFMDVPKPAVQRQSGRTPNGTFA